MDLVAAFGQRVGGAIHRNTVIYRLDKISRLTARDVREPQVAIAAYRTARTRTSLTDRIR